MITAIDDNKRISDAEIKLGLNLFKAFVKIMADDSAKVIEMKESLVKIDDALKSADEEKLLGCNREMTARFRMILLAPGTGLIAIDEATMRAKSFAQKYCSLWAIGDCLIREINKEKFAEAVVEGTKVGIEYVVDKATQNRTVL